MIKRMDIITEARSWIGTPYRHQASLKGAGADCLGLLRGVYAAVVGPVNETIPPYDPNWNDASEGDQLLFAAGRYLEPVIEYQPGDVLVFRLANRYAAKHCAIVAQDGRMIHARTNAAVELVTISQWYHRRIAGRFAFRGVTEWQL